MPDSTFTQRCWKDIEQLRLAILEHPFLLGLVDGTLPEHRFRSYVIQDSLYLLSYARTLAAIAARARSPADTSFLAGSAVSAVAVEQELSSTPSSSGCSSSPRRRCRPPIRCRCTCATPRPH